VLFSLTKINNLAFHDNAHHRINDFRDVLDFQKLYAQIVEKVFVVNANVSIDAEICRAIS